MLDRPGVEFAAQAHVEGHLFATIIGEVIGPQPVSIGVQPRHSVAREGDPRLPVFGIRTHVATDAFERECLAQFLFDDQRQREALRVVCVEARGPVVDIGIDFLPAGCGQKCAGDRQELVRGVRFLIRVIGQDGDFGAGSRTRGEGRREDELVVRDFLDLRIGIAV